jgi:rod shape-determining protein MreC
MPLGTLDRTPPPFFKQGPSALSKLIFFSTLALFLMVADARLKVSQPLRAVAATALYPLQWLVMQPVYLAQNASAYVGTVKSAQQTEAQARQKLALQALRSNQVEHLTSGEQPVAQTARPARATDGPITARGSPV